MNKFINEILIVVNNKSLILLQYNNCQKKKSTIKINNCPLLKVKKFQLRNYTYYKMNALNFEYSICVNSKKKKRNPGGIIILVQLSAAFEIIIQFGRREIHFSSRGCKKKKKKATTSRGTPMKYQREYFTQPLPTHLPTSPFGKSWLLPVLPPLPPRC